MHACLVSFDSLQQRSNLAPATALVPAGKPRTQVQAKHSRLSAGWNDLEKRMTRARRIVPLVIRNLVAAEKTDRMPRARGPKRKARVGSQAFDNVRMRRFLEDHEIGIRGFNDLCQRLLAADSTKSDVVTE